MRRRSRPAARRPLRRAAASPGPCSPISSLGGAASRPGSAWRALLFPEADDPLGRAALEPGRPAPRPRPLRRGRRRPGAADAGRRGDHRRRRWCGRRHGLGSTLGGDWAELLEGMAFDGCPGFETWLLVERRRLASACEALLHEEALRHLGSGRFGPAVEAAGRPLHPRTPSTRTTRRFSYAASPRRASAMRPSTRWRAASALFEPRARHRAVASRTGGRRR